MTLRTSILAANVRTALGDDLDQTWDALVAGRTGVKPLVGFDTLGFGDVEVAQVFTEGVGMEDDPALRILGPHGRLLERVATRVHEDGGAASVDRSSVGLFVALGMVDAVVEDLVQAARASRNADGDFDLARFFRGGYRQIHPLWPLSMLNNVAVGQLSIDLDVRGDNLVVASEADGCVRAILEGAYATRDGRVAAALTGGVSEPLMPASLARAKLRGTLGLGAAPGEGAAALLLGLERASAPATLIGGATVFGAEDGRTGASRDAYGRAFQGALAAADTAPEAIDAVFLHAAGPAGEAEAELQALRDVFGERELRLVATKGALGHAGPAAPAIDLALAVRAMDTRRVPPSLPAAWMSPALRDVLAPPGDASLNRILVSAASSAGAVGALVVEGGV